MYSLKYLQLKNNKNNHTSHLRLEDGKCENMGKSRKSDRKECV